MIKKIFLACICFSSLLVAEEPSPGLNAIGWENGLSYRRYLSPKLWAGVTVNGRIEDRIDNDSNMQTSYRSDPDTVFIRNSTSNDTSIGYRGTVKLSLGRELLRIKIVALDLFVAGSYSYSNDKTKVSGSRFEQTNGPSHTIAGLLGLEPKVWIVQRLGLGTQFGASYSYSVSKTERDREQTYYDRNIDTQKSFHRNHSAKLFGDFSLNMNLNAHFYF